MGKMFNVASREHLQQARVVNHHCNPMWTTNMAATVSCQNMVVVSSDSVEDAGKWHLWETLPPALSICIIVSKERHKDLNVQRA